MSDREDDERWLDTYDGKLIELARVKARLADLETERAEDHTSLSLLREENRRLKLENKRLKDELTIQGVAIVQTYGGGELPAHAKYGGGSAPMTSGGSAGWSVFGAGHGGGPNLAVGPTIADLEREDREAANGPLRRLWHKLVG